MARALLALILALLGGASPKARTDIGSNWDPDGVGGDVGNTWDPDG